MHYIQQNESTCRSPSYHRRRGLGHFAAAIQSPSFLSGEAVGGNKEGQSISLYNYVILQLSLPRFSLNKSTVKS